MPVEHARGGQRHWTRGVMAFRRAYGGASHARLPRHHGPQRMAEAGEAMRGTMGEAVTGPVVSTMVDSVVGPAPCEARRPQPVVQRHGPGAAAGALATGLATPGGLVHLSLARAH